MEVDRSTFNYGAALGAPKPDVLDWSVAPWERADIGAQYAAAEAFCSALGDIVMTFSGAQWKLEMALRDVRCACSLQEQQDAMDALRRAYVEVDRALATVKAGGIRFDRYGRVGTVLRWFNPFKATKASGRVDGQ